MKLNQLKKKLQKKLRFPIYGNETLKIAFEFGLVLSETANKLKVELTSITSVKAEEILIKELKENGLDKTALNFVPLIMTILEESAIEEEKK